MSSPRPEAFASVRAEPVEAAGQLPRPRLNCTHLSGVRLSTCTSLAPACRVQAHLRLDAARGLSLTAKTPLPLVLPARLWREALVGRAGNHPLSFVPPAPAPARYVAPYPPDGFAPITAITNLTGPLGQRCTPLNPVYPHSVPSS